MTVHGLKISQVCKASGVGRTKIYEEIGEGRLKARKAGRATIVLSTDFEDWLKSLPTIHD